MLCEVVAGAANNQLLDDQADDALLSQHNITYDTIIPSHNITTWTTKPCSSTSNLLRVCCLSSCYVV